MVKKIVSVVGARPQFVKAAVVSEQLRLAGIEEALLHTGQHYDSNMSDVFFQSLSIPTPKYHLGLGGGLHGEMTGRQLIEIEKCLLVEKPDGVLVYGDTNSTLAGALAAAKLHIPLAHVEAGLRSFNRRMPEEINRIITDRIADWLYTPSPTASAHLIAEGVPADRIVEVGDVMFDATLRFAGHAPTRIPEAARVALVTVHRAENTDDPVRLNSIVEGLRCLVDAGWSVRLPLHPRTRAELKKRGWLEALAARIEVMEPLGYREMLQAVRSSDVVVTDSGGLQKEAYFLSVPCVTLRGETEWVETIELGWNRLVTSLDPVAIVEAVTAARPPVQAVDRGPYGDGSASRRIAEHLLRVL